MSHQEGKDPEGNTSYVEASVPVRALVRNTVPPRAGPRPTQHEHIVPVGSWFLNLCNLRNLWIVW
jgi:hypothetical protein